MTDEQKPVEERTACSECGGPLLYGSRHHQCGTVAMKYQKIIAALEQRLAAAEAEKQAAIDAALENLADIFEDRNQPDEAYTVRCRIGTNPLAEAQARIAELEHEVHNLNWALGADGYPRMATEEEQAAHEAGYAAVLDRLSNMKKRGDKVAELEAKIAELERTVQLLNQTACIGVDNQIDAQQKIAALTAQLAEAQASIDRIEMSETITRLTHRIKVITTWLEQHQPDVFRRGLWDALTQADAAMKENVEARKAAGPSFSLPPVVGPGDRLERVDPAPFDESLMEKWLNDQGIREQWMEFVKRHTMKEIADD